MRGSHASVLVFGVVQIPAMPYMSTYDLLQRSRSRDRRFPPPRSQVQCLGSGSSDPTSPRREASLFDLAPGA